MLKLLIALSFFLSSAYAGLDTKLVGEWVTNAPGTGNRVVLKIDADGRCSVGAQAGKCQSLLRMLVMQVPGAQATTYTYQVKNERLTIAGGGLAQALVFERSVAGAATEPAVEAAAPVTPMPPAIQGQAQGQTQRQGQYQSQGQRYAHPYWGLSFLVPGTWNVTEREGLLLLGSNSEAGLIVVRFARSTNRQMMLAEYSKGYTEEGITLTPATRAEDFAGGANRGVAGELAGYARDRSKLRARVIGIQSQFGDAAILMGLTTDEKYPALKSRVDEIASGMQFSAPRIPPANQTVAGNYYYIYVSTSGGNYSREDKLMLCANGMFSRGGEMYGSGRNGTAATANANAGSWTADGDGMNGTITLTYRNGRTESMRYQKSGPDIVLNGKKYGRNGDGNCGGR